MVSILCGPGDAGPGGPDYKGMILSSEASAEPEQWLELFETYGIILVRDLFDELTEPALDSYEVAEKFREDSDRPEPTGAEPHDG